MYSRVRCIVGKPLQNPTAIMFVESVRAGRDLGEIYWDGYNDGYVFHAFDGFMEKCGEDGGAIIADIQRCLDIINKRRTSEYMIGGGADEIMQPPSSFQAIVPPVLRKFSDAHREKLSAARRAYIARRAAEKVAAYAPPPPPQA